MHASQQQHTISLAEPLHEELIAEVRKQSVYIDTGLYMLDVGPQGTQVHLTLDGRRAAEIVARTQRFLDAIRRGFRRVDLQTAGHHVRRAARPCASNVFARLLELGWVLDLGPGQVALAGPALALANALDRSIVQVAASRFGAKQRAYPALIPAQVLARCGYTSSFPQHLSIVTHLEEDFDAIERFRAANVDSTDLSIPEPGAFGRPKVCLCPALCYHCYPTLENTTLPPQGHVETSIGRIARYESSGMVGLDRLWDFTQRSIIWLGGEAFCSDRRELAMTAAIDLARAWDIDCTIETASDPFFTSVSTAKSFWQKGQALKFELRAGVEPEPDGRARTIAAASFNLHGAYFGNAFDIAIEGGEPASSGCASWGLERLVLVICTQHGCDPAGWPAALRALMADADDGVNEPEEQRT
jgi:seryl-tRNA synthetase